jgi:thioredoxin 1
MKTLILAAALVAFIPALASNSPAQEPKPITATVVNITDATFHDEVVRTYDPVVLEIWAPYCPACRKMGSTMDELAHDYAGKIKIVKANTEVNKEAPLKYRGQYIPRFFYIKDGNVLGTAVGSMSKADLIKKLGLPKP